MAAALLGRTDVGIREYGTKTSVPDQPKDKLMYYLDCVCGLLDMSRESNLTKLRSYTRPHLLTEVETDALVTLCFLLSPEELVGKVIFQDDVMCRGVSNTFYELSAVRHSLLVYDSVLVGGRTRAVTKIMACKRQWLADYWVEPMKVYAHRLARIAGQSRARGGASGSSGCCCTIL